MSRFIRNATIQHLNDLIDFNLEKFREVPEFQETARMAYLGAVAPYMSELRTRALVEDTERAIAAEKSVQATHLAQVSEWVNAETGEVVSQDIMAEWLETGHGTDSVRFDAVPSSTRPTVQETSLATGIVTGTFQLMSQDEIAALFAYPSDPPVRVTVDTAPVLADWERDLLDDPTMAADVTVATLVDLAQLYRHRDLLTSAAALDQAVNSLKIIGVTRDLFAVTAKAARVLVQDDDNAAIVDASLRANTLAARNR